MLLLILTGLLLLTGVYAQAPQGYEYRLTLKVSNLNPYPLRNYTIMTELNLQPYTQSDYNDIRVFISGGDGIEELNYSKEILPDGNVMLYIYVDEIPQRSVRRLYIYVGKPNDTDHSITKTEALGKYLAIRIGDAELGGDLRIPKWSELSSCYRRYWRDAGYDIFDNFGYPILNVDGSTGSLYMSPYSNCNPYSKRVRGIYFRYEVKALGYAPGYHSDPHNPYASKQRIWAMEILPRCDTSISRRYYELQVRGNFGFDDYTYDEDHVIDLYGESVKIHHVYDMSDDSRPDVFLVGISGYSQPDEMYRLSDDDLTHRFYFAGTPQPIIYIIGLMDIGDYFDSWLRNATYLGERCYVDQPLKVTLEKVDRFYRVEVIMPDTVYRGHTTTVTVYYDGNEPIDLNTDWGQELYLEQIDENTYEANLYVDTTVPVGEHHLYAYVEGNLVYTVDFQVAYGGEINIQDITFTDTVIKGLTYDLAVPITCTYDTCQDVYISLESNGCVPLSNTVETNLDVNTTTVFPMKLVCYDEGTYSATVHVSTPYEEINRTVTFSVISPASGGGMSVTVDLPETVPPDENIPITISMGGYDGNVTVSLLDSSLNAIETVDATPNGNGTYVATISTTGLDDGYYYVLVAGDTFNVMKVLTVSHTAFINRYGLVADNAYGKPVSILGADVNGETVTLRINVKNLRNTPLTVDASELTEDGGIINLPSDFISVLDEATVTNESNTVSYEVSYTYDAGSISVVWHTPDNTLVLNPGDNIFILKIPSPYVRELERAVQDTNDPNAYTYLQRMLGANTLREQIEIYNEFQQYVSTSLLGSIDISIAVPPGVVQYSNSYGFVYIKNGSSLVDPDETTCEIIGEDGNHVADCTLQRVDTGVYKVALKTDQTGVFGVSVSARKGIYTSKFTAYYNVTSAYKPGEVVVTNFVIPPNGTTMVIYNQDPVATVTLRMFDTSGNLIKTANMTYSDDIGAFIYELNVGDVPDGDYIVVVSDSFGYSDRAVIHVSSILEDILNTVSDVNSFLNNVIAPKLDSIDNKLDTVLDNQTNLYQAIEDVNDQVTQVLNVLDQLDNNLDQYHQDTVQRLEELNDLAHQILQEVLYIKNKIDNVVITKLDMVLENQEGMQGDLNDIKLMLDCNKPSAVCVQLQNIQLLLNDIQSDLNNHHNEVINRLDRIESKVDTLTDYTDSLRDMLNCEYNYPRTSICAKLDVLEERADLIRQEVEDVNSFLNRIYDYVRNDLTNEVIEVGRKVEDINDYLHGDVWNKLVTIHSRIEGLYNEANYIESLIQGHDATVQAMLINLKSYLQDVNSSLSTQIDSAKNEILQKLDPIESNVEDILNNTEALIAYFHCSSPNEVCTRLQNIEAEANTIHTKVNELQEDVNELRSISVYEFHQIRQKLDLIENNVTELKQLVDCATYPSSPICLMLNSVLDDTNNIKQKLDELNRSMFDLYHEISHQVGAVRDIATGGGGGGPSSVKAIKVVYKHGSVFVAVPEYIPSGKYTVRYTGELYRYVEYPEPGKEIEVNNGILELKLRSGVSGVISGEILLRNNRGYYRIRVDIVADDRLNQRVMVNPASNVVTLDIPKGGAIVTFRGALKECAPSPRLIFTDGGKKKIKLKCRADGVIEIQPRDLRQATIQISVSQKPQIIANDVDIMRTTIIPIAGFIAFLYVLSLLGLA